MKWHTLFYQEKKLVVKYFRSLRALIWRISPFLLMFDENSWYSKQMLFNKCLKFLRRSWDLLKKKILGLTVYLLTENIKSKFNGIMLIRTLFWASSLFILLFKIFLSFWYLDIKDFAFWILKILNYVTYEKKNTSILFR